MKTEAHSISSQNTQMSAAFAAAQKMRRDHGDRSYSIRDIVSGMLVKAEDGRTVTISPGIARRIIDEANFPSQRRITEDRLYDQKRSIADGTWNPHHVIHFVRLEDGAFWLVNGQTRLTAIAECGTPQKIGIIIQRVKDEHEARRVYTEFDKSTAVRTTEQLMNASGVATEHGLPKQLATYLFSAVGIINNGMRVPTGSINNQQSVAARNTANKLRWVGEWAREAALFRDDISDAMPNMRRSLMRGGTMAVAILTYRHQEARAHEFWRGVAEGVNLKKNDPRLALARDIDNRNNAVGMGNVSVQQSALAWNAFVQGRELKIIKVTDDWRLYIAGTPYGKAGK